MAENFRRKLYPKYKRKKKKIHPDDVAPEVGHKQELDKRQAVQDADMEEGAYLKDPETEVDTSQPLQIRGNPSFDVNQNKKPLTERQKEREDRLRQRAGSGQQGADIAKKKLPKSKLTDLPQFLQVHQDADLTIKQGIKRDKEKYDPTDELIRQGKLKEAHDLHPDINPQVKNALTIAAIFDPARKWYTNEGKPALGDVVDGVVDFTETSVENVVNFLSGFAPDPASFNEVQELLLDAKKKEFDYRKITRPLGTGGGTLLGLLVDSVTGNRKSTFTLAGATAGGKGGEIVGTGINIANRIPYNTGLQVLRIIRNSNTPNKMSGSGGGDIPNQKSITPNITPSNEKTLKKMGLWEAFREFNVDEFGGKVTRKQAKAIVTPEIPGFTKAQAERLGKLPELRSFYSNLTDAQIIPELDHANPLKLAAYLMDKTTGAKRVKIRKIILDEGIYLGEMAENLRALPREVHAVWTRHMNKYMGKSHKNFQDTFLAEMTSLGITEPEDIAKEYVKRIKDGNVKFNKIYDAHKRTYGTVTDSNIDDLVSKLDEAYELGDEWAPARTRRARQDINKDLSNLDKYPLNNLPPGKEGLQQIVDKLGLSDFKNVDLEKFSKLSLSKQMSQLKKRSGMDINEIQELLQTSNIDIQTILDMIE